LAFDRHIFRHIGHDLIDGGLVGGRELRGLIHSIHYGGGFMLSLPVSFMSMLKKRTFDPLGRFGAGKWPFLIISGGPNQGAARIVR
jgi:hypothetical protein